jgi:hypothetical protein
LSRFSAVFTAAVFTAAVLSEGVFAAAVLSEGVFTAAVFGRRCSLGLASLVINATSPAPP